MLIFLIYKKRKMKTEKKNKNKIKSWTKWNKSSKETLLLWAVYYLNKVQPILFIPWNDYYRCMQAVWGAAEMCSGGGFL